MSDDPREMLREMVDLLAEIAENTRRSQRTKTTRAKNMPDDEWLAEICARPAYKGIDVRNEFGKASLWCDTHRKVLTRPRFVNWLNRIERPMKPPMTQLPPVMYKPVERRPQGDAPPPEVAATLSKLLGKEMTF